MSSINFLDSIEYDLMHESAGKLFYDKYELLHLIYNSENSSVYLVKDKRTGTRYTLKSMIKDNNIQDIDLNILKRINHPNIVKVTSVFETSTRIYIIKEYIKGDSLEFIVNNKGVLQEHIVIKIAEQLCDILKYLHNIQPYKIIFRDLKPSNILYCDDGKVMLIDLASCREYKSQSKRDTCYIGTIEYAAPEQFGFGQTNERTDIYNLGMTLYYLLMGKQLENKRIKTYRDINTSKKLAKIIAKCIQFDPEKRYASVCEVLRDLKRKDLKCRTILICLSIGVVSVLCIGTLMFHIQGYFLKSPKINLFSKDINKENSFFETTSNTKKQSITELNVIEKDDKELSDKEVSGVVIYPDGTPISLWTSGLVNIEIRTLNGNFITSTSCQEDGTFSLDISDIKDGDYFIRIIKDNRDGYAVQPDKHIKIIDNKVTSGDLKLHLYDVQINGQILDSEGNPFNENISVFEVNDSKWVTYVGSKDSEGFYYIGGLELGKHKLMFRTYSGLIKYIDVVVTDEVQILDLLMH